MKSKVHNYTRQVPGKDYFLSNAPSEGEGDRFYMTGYGYGIKPNDYILLSSGRYQVMQIDYYGNYPDLWMALLAPSP